MVPDGAMQRHHTRSWSRAVPRAMTWASPGTIASPAS